MDQAGIMRFLGQASDLPFAIRKLGLSATAGLVRTHLEEYGSKIAGRATASDSGSARRRVSAKRIRRAPRIDCTNPQWR